MYTADDSYFDSQYNDWYLEPLEMGAPPISWWVDAKPLTAAERFERSEVSGEAAGPGNTDTSTRHTFWRLAGGVDTLEATIYGRFTSSYLEMQSRLETARQCRIDRKPGGSIAVLGATFVVRTKGHPWANTFMHWVLDYDGISISLAKDGQSDTCPVAKVQIGSLKLMRDGYRESWAQALQLLEQLGIDVVTSTCSRIDPCVDLAGVAVGAFVEAVRNRRHVTRLRGDIAYYETGDGVWTGVAIGANAAVHVRIYDKVAQLRIDKEADAKREVLIERRWGSLPECASRVEFQIKGAWLRSRWADCKTVEQVFDRLDSIMEYLLTQFFRLVDGDVDRENRNQSRLPCAPLWLDVIAAFKDWVSGEVVELIRMEKKAADQSKVAKRLVSAAVSAACLAPSYVVDRASLMQWTVDLLSRNLPDDTVWLSKVEEKCLERLASGAAGVFSFEGFPDAAASGFRVVDEMASQLVPF